MKEAPRLRYLGPQKDRRDQVDQIIEFLLGKTFKVETAGTESNIPREGPLVAAFASHGGSLESLAANKGLKGVRKPPVWMTKAENKTEIPSWLTGDRSYVYIKRGETDMAAIRLIMQILAAENGSLGSALEGTRKGNPKNPNDLRTLGRAQPGLVYFALKAGREVPILPVMILGADQVLAQLDVTKNEKGSWGVVSELAKAVLSKKKPIFQIRFLPPYRKHYQEYQDFQGGKLSEYCQRHADNILRKIIAQILLLDPNYPLGPYGQEVPLTPA